MDWRLVFITSYSIFASDYSLIYKFRTNCIRIYFWKSWEISPSKYANVNIPNALYWACENRLIPSSLAMK
jgi:hypothetical protein